MSTAPRPPRRIEPPWPPSPGVLAGKPKCSCLLCPHREVGAPAAVESLGGHDLVDVSPQVQADIPPGVDVVGEGDGDVAAGGPLRGPDTPVLKERPGAVDGRCVDSLRSIEV